jgi:hypothetical protein
VPRGSAHLAGADRGLEHEPDGGLVAAMMKLVASGCPAAASQVAIKGADFVVGEGLDQ